MKKITQALTKPKHETPNRISFAPEHRASGDELDYWFLKPGPHRRICVPLAAYHNPARAADAAMKMEGVLGNSVHLIIPQRWT